MPYIEPPNINTSTKTNEQNMQIIKAYMNEMTAVVNNFMATVDERLSKIESKIGEEE